MTQPSPADTLQAARETFAGLAQAEREVSRLDGYRGLSHDMRRDRARWINAAASAREQLAELLAGAK